MDWLKQIAPTIATALGGPLAGLAVEAISKAIGVSPDDTQALLTSGKMTAEQIAQVKVAEIELQKQAASLGLDFEKLAVDDRKSAREMQTSTRSFTVPVLAYVIVGSFVGMVACTLAGWAKVDSVLAGTLVGYLSAKCEQVIGFYFGSSKGSEDKNVLLANSTPAAP